MRETKVLSQDVLLERSRSLRLYSKDLLEEARELCEKSKKIRDANVFIAACASNSGPPRKVPSVIPLFILQTELGALAAGQFLKTLRVSGTMNGDLRRSDFDLS